ncbi:MAG: HAMP domain-containing protein [Deltaproteobacteria bacterium]|nr:HAMP domain-containing protein [Deltaproteobacteria bacterium]
MPFRMSIFFKLLLLILPLACIPIAVVGYLSVQASVERVNRLVRQEQMVQVESAAQKINQVFHYCRTDLDTMTGLPVLEDYHLARAFRLSAEARFNQENLSKLFQDFLSRNEFYYQIRLLDQKGRELIVVGRQGDLPVRASRGETAYFRQALALGPAAIYFSGLVNSVDRRGYLIHAAKCFVTGWREPAGVLVIDLDFEKIIQVVRNVQVGRIGYSFLIDQLGRILVHPQYAPYTLHPGNYPGVRLPGLIKDMMAGHTGWESYLFQGQEKVAAYAPIPIMKWSLAVTIPVEEFGREARLIRERVIQVVGITLVITLLGVSILSYNLLRPVRRLVVATDRLARGDLSQEIKVQSNDELGDLTRSFNRMTTNLAKMQTELVRSEKLVSLGRLSAGVAHEIRNPLNAMKGAMVHLRQRWSHEPLIEQYTTLVSEEIDRLNRVVSEFLFFAKQAPPKPQKLDFNQGVLRAQELLAEQAAAGGVSFVNRLDPDLPPVYLDPYQVEQVLLNVVINALDASQPGGTITFTTGARDEAAGRRVWLTVEDQGRGISPEDLPYVCDPFFTTKEEGTGLGLPLSLGIVESHGGSLELASELGSGTRVTMVFPLVVAWPAVG